MRPVPKRRVNRGSGWHGNSAGHRAAALKGRRRRAMRINPATIRKRPKWDRPKGRAARDWLPDFYGRGDTRPQGKNVLFVHHTMTRRAEQITKSQRLKASPGGFVYGTNWRNKNWKVMGNASVGVRVPRRDVEIHSVGRQELRIKRAKLRGLPIRRLR